MATEKDLPEISLLWKSLVRESSKNSNPDVEGWINFSRELMKNPDYFIFVYTKDDEIIGFIDGIIYYEPSAAGKVGSGRHFYVKPEHRNTCVASALLEEIVVHASLNGVRSLELNCVEDKKRYWEKRGFKKTQHVMRMDL